LSINFAYKFECSYPAKLKLDMITFSSMYGVREVGVLLLVHPDTKSPK